MKENSYSIDKPISFRGTGDFVFVEDIKKNEKDQNSFIRSGNDFFFSGDAYIVLSENDYVASINDNTLTIHCKS